MALAWSVGRARNQLSKRRHRLRVRNDVDAESGRFDFVYGEAHTVHSDGAFASYVAREIGGHGDLDTYGMSITADGHNFREAIDMARHEMTTKGIAHLERRLQIHGRTNSQITESG